MAWLKYYDNEHKRHPVLHTALISQFEARHAISRLYGHFMGRSGSPLHVEFTSGNRVSHAIGKHFIKLNVRGLNWLLVIHEFAHVWDSHRRKRSRHDKKHAKLVDRVCAYVMKQGWHEHSLAHELALREDSKLETEKKRAAPPSVDERLALKYEQLAKLETKRKRLDTLISKKKRSIAAIERAAARKGSHGSQAPETHPSV